MFLSESDVSSLLNSFFFSSHCLLLLMDIETADESVNGVVSVGIRRSVPEGNNSLILATERTRREDPSRDFKYYTGGWNISDKHYFYESVSVSPVFFFNSISSLSFMLIFLDFGIVQKIFNSIDPSDLGFSPSSIRFKILRVFFSPPSSSV
ncbi:hypothetical protein NMG60_11017130 [Bertholletia excelsa]